MCTAMHLPALPLGKQTSDDPDLHEVTMAGESTCSTSFIINETLSDTKTLQRKRAGCGVF